MKALIFDGTLHLDRDYPLPVPSAGEALISVQLAGICNTDLEITRGYADFKGILGHEFVGTVQDSPSKDLIGKRVVGEINCVCQTCAFCRDGLSSHCPNRSVVGIVGHEGVFAEYATIPERNLHIVPDGLSDEEAVFTEPLAAAWQMLEQIHIKPTERVAVLGDGKLGILAAQVLSLVGSDVIVGGHHAEKRRILEKLGIRTCHSDELADSRFDVVVECTGHSDGLLMARKIVRPRGTIILKSTYAGDSRFPFSPMVVDEVRIVGSRCGPFAPALRSLQRGLIAVKPLISAIRSIENSEEAFHQAVDSGSLKVLIRPTG